MYTCHNISLLQFTFEHQNNWNYNLQCRLCYVTTYNVGNKLHRTLYSEHNFNTKSFARNCRQVRPWYCPAAHLLTSASPTRLTFCSFSDRVSPLGTHDVTKPRLRLGHSASVVPDVNIYRHKGLYFLVGDDDNNNESKASRKYN